MLMRPVPCPNYSLQQKGPSSLRSVWQLGSLCPSILQLISRFTSTFVFGQQLIGFYLVKGRKSVPGIAVYSHNGCIWLFVAGGVILEILEVFQQASLMWSWQGASSDCAIRQGVKKETQMDLSLVPDPSQSKTLPWLPSQEQCGSKCGQMEWFFCTIWHSPSRYSPFNICQNLSLISTNYFQACLEVRLKAELYYYGKPLCFGFEPVTDEIAFIFTENTRQQQDSLRGHGGFSRGTLRFLCTCAH